MPTDVGATPTISGCAVPLREPLRASAFVCALVTGLLAVAPAGASSTSGVANVAHRGASGSAPENTLASVAQAIADHADFVELDVRLTKDGVPVVLHDADLRRTTDVETVFPGRSPWALRDFTLDEVRRLDAGSWRSRSYARERVPTLAAVLRHLKRSPSGAYLHVKNASTYGGVDGIGAKVYETVKAEWPGAWTAEGRRRLFVQSAEQQFLEEFAARYPEVPVAVILRSSTLDDVAAFADDVQVQRDSATPQMAADAHDAGLTIGAWTVDDRAGMSGFADDVDSITTNHPARLRGVLARRGMTYTGTRLARRGGGSADLDLENLRSLPPQPGGRPGQADGDRRGPCSVAVGRCPAPGGWCMAHRGAARDRCVRQVHGDHPGLPGPAGAGGQPRQRRVPGRGLGGENGRTAQDGELRPALRPTRRQAAPHGGPDGPLACGRR